MNLSLLVVVVVFLSTAEAKATHNLNNAEVKKLKLNKDTWLRNNLRSSKEEEFSSSTSSKKTKRSLMSLLEAKEREGADRPCPLGCNCNYNTVSCNDLVDSCSECVHWSQIDFNQIGQLRAESFARYSFAPNRTTQIIIYKLINSTLAPHTLDGLRLPANSHVEITFQYNSKITFDVNALSGLSMGANSTLVFNFPYTTQVVFMARCFSGMRMADARSRLIVRVLKSFSVRFLGDALSLPRRQQKYDESTREVGKEWELGTGQLILDIKSTHLVKFEDRSFVNARLRDGARFYLDMVLIEKLMIQRHAFHALTLRDASAFTFFAKQVTFINFRAYSLSGFRVSDGSRAQIYLEELAASLCIQRHVFAGLTLSEAHSSFNFSVINSKNVQLMHHAFAHVRLEHSEARLHVGVYHMPSALLVYHQPMAGSSEFYQRFVSRERHGYLWPQPRGHFTYSSHQSQGGMGGMGKSLASRHHYIHQQGSRQYLQGNYMQQAVAAAGSYPLTANEYNFYNYLNQHHYTSINSDDDGNENGGGDSSSERKEKNVPLTLDLTEFYQSTTFRQSYLYNTSVEHDCFANLTVLSQNSNNIWLVNDNVHTVLIDDSIVSYSKNNKNNMDNNNLNFVLNVRNFALSERALANLAHVRVEFLRDPEIFKLGLDDSATTTQAKVKLIGFRFTDIDNENNIDFKQTKKNDFEQNDIDFVDEYGSEKKKNTKDSKTTTSITQLDDNCQTYNNDKSNISSNRNSFIVDLELRDGVDRTPCSCQIVYFYSKRQGSLPCKLPAVADARSSFLQRCQEKARKKCDRKIVKNHNNNNSSSSEFLAQFVPFWKYCITEKGPWTSHRKIKDSNSTSMYFNPLYAPVHLSAVAYYDGRRNTNNNNNKINNKNQVYETFGWNGMTESGDQYGSYDFSTSINENSAGGGGGRGSASWGRQRMPAHYLHRNNLGGGDYDANNKVGGGGMGGVNFFGSSSYQSGGAGSYEGIHYSKEGLPLLDDSRDNSNNNNGGGENGGEGEGGVGKMIGIVIVCFICGVVLFMIVVNVIQYKFRSDDLLDEFDFDPLNSYNNNMSTSPGGQRQSNQRSPMSNGGGGGPEKEGGAGARVGESGGGNDDQKLNFDDDGKMKNSYTGNGEDDEDDDDQDGSEDENYNNEKIVRRRSNKEVNVRKNYDYDDEEEDENEDYCYDRRSQQQQQQNYDDGDSDFEENNNNQEENLYRNQKAAAKNKGKYNARDFSIEMRPLRGGGLENEEDDDDEEDVRISRDMITNDSGNVSTTTATPINSSPTTAKEFKCEKKQQQQQLPRRFSKIK